MAGKAKIALEKTFAFPWKKRHLTFRQLDELSISRHGISSVERVFSDDLKPGGREQSGRAVSLGH
jgi:hypothetical protein